MDKSPPRKKQIDIFKSDRDLQVGREVLAEAIGVVEEKKAPRKSRSRPGKMRTKVSEGEGEKGALGAERGDGAHGSEGDKSVSPVAQTIDANLKFRVRQGARTGFDSFKTELSAALGGARLMDSNLGRALIDWFLEEASNAVLEAAKQKAGALQRPASDDLAAMAAFDGALRELIADGIAKAKGRVNRTRPAGENQPLEAVPDQGRS